MRLEAESVRVRLGRRAAVQDVTAQFDAGRFHAIVGPNGAGKTTFLRALAGLERLDGGRIRLDAQDLGHYAPRERARRLAFVPQNVHLEYPFTVEEVVGMGRYARRSMLGGPEATDRDAIRGALDACRLRELAERPVTKLSRGEQQRALLARALAQDTPILLLDEPTSNLDLAQTDHAHRLLSGLAKEGRTIIAVLHDLAAATRLADRILFLQDGRVLSDGPPRQAISPETLAQAFQAPMQVTWDEEGARIRVVADSKHNP